MNINLEKKFNELISKDYKLAINDIADAADFLGVKIYLIGGIARDLILQTVIKDIDITVLGDAVELAQYLQELEKCKVIAIQDDLRTAKVEFKSGIIIDLASTREEYYIKGGMLPVIKEIGVDIEKDVKRRDFTINTIAIALNGGEKYNVIDYYDGYKDIKEKKIRILHEKSFTDDPSRIVRAIKFQIRLEFKIEEKTEFLMNEYLNNVDKTIPLDRIKNEIKQYFSIDNNKIYKNFIEKNVYKLICDNPIVNIDINSLKKMQEYYDINKKWFIYFSLLIVNSNIENLKLSLTSKEKKIIKEVKELLKKFSIEENNKLKIYNSFIKTSDLTPVIYYVITKNKSVLKYYKELRYKKVLITGKDLIEMGYSPSAYFNEIFQNILKEKLEGRLKTKEDEIMYVKKIIS